MIEPRVIVRPVVADDRDEFLALMQASRTLHEPWISPPLTARGLRRLSDAHEPQRSRRTDRVPARTSGNRRSDQSEQHRAGFVPECVARLLRGSPLRRAGLHDQRLESDGAVCIRRNGTTQARSEHPAEQRAVDQSRETLRLRQRRLLSEIPLHRRCMARPPALGNLSGRAIHCTAPSTTTLPCPEPPLTAVGRRRSAPNSSPPASPDSAASDR